VLPVAFLLLAAAVLRGSRAGPAGSDKGPTAGSRIGFGLLSIIALAVIAIPMVAVREIRDSQADVRAGQLGSALSAADSAERFEPFAASPDLQRALVLEMQGNLGDAVTAAREAAREESTNWRIWLTLSRIQAERGNPQAAVAAYRKARSLNPRSPIFVAQAGAQQ
jgi:tetratricopeptide (TPR) repeat protein